MTNTKVYEYLNGVFERIRNCDFNKMEDLVPWSEKKPEYVRIGGEKRYPSNPPPYNNHRPHDIIEISCYEGTVRK